MRPIIAKLALPCSPVCATAQNSNAAPGKLQRTWQQIRPSGPESLQPARWRPPLVRGRCNPPAGAPGSGSLQPARWRPRFGTFAVRARKSVANERKVDTIVHFSPISGGVIRTASKFSLVGAFLALPFSAEWLDCVHFSSICATSLASRREARRHLASRRRRDGISASPARFRCSITSEALAHRSAIGTGEPMRAAVAVERPSRPVERCML